MVSPVFILDIHRLLESICFQLDHYDISNCRLISKAWYAAFTPVYWASVHIHASGPVLPFHRQSHLLEHAHHFRSLTSEVLYSQFLVGSESGCTLLKELVVTDQFHAPDPVRLTWIVESSAMSNVKGSRNIVTAMDLVAQNPGLQSLSLSQCSFLRGYFPGHVLHSLRRHYSLRELRLDLKRFQMNYSVLIEIMRHLPPLLTVLDIRATCGATERPLGIQAPILWPEIGLDNQTGTHFSLQHLCLQTDFPSSAGPFLRGILEKSLDLRSLVLKDRCVYDWTEDFVQRLMVCCPKLSVFDVGHDLATGVVLKMARGFRGLKVLKARSYSRQKYLPSGLVSALVANSAETLEVLDLDIGMFSESDVAILLKSCPNLKEFNSSGIVPSLERELLRWPASMQSLVQMPWACHGRIETLSLSLAHSWYDVGSSMNDQVMEPAFLALYRLLCTFPRLKQVKLRWPLGDEGVTLDFDHGKLVRAFNPRTPGRVAPGAIVLTLLRHSPFLEEIDLMVADLFSQRMGREGGPMPCNYGVVHLSDIIASVPEWACQGRLGVLDLAFQDDHSSFSPGCDRDSGEHGLVQLLQLLDDGEGMVFRSLRRGRLVWWFKGKVTVIYVNFDECGLYSVRISNASRMPHLDRMVSGLLDHWPQLELHIAVQK